MICELFWHRTCYLECFWNPLRSMNPPGTNMEMEFYWPTSKPLSRSCPPSLWACIQAVCVCEGIPPQVISKLHIPETTHLLHIILFKVKSQLFRGSKANFDSLSPPYLKRLCYMWTWGGASVRPEKVTFKSGVCVMWLRLEHIKPHSAQSLSQLPSHWWFVGDIIWSMLFRPWPLIGVHLPLCALCVFVYTCVNTFFPA